MPEIYIETTYRGKEGCGGKTYLTSSLNREMGISDSLEPGPLARYRLAEAACRARWPKVCPHCGGRRLVPRFDVPELWSCESCRMEFSAEGDG